MYFGHTTQLLLSLSQRKVSTVVIIAPITVGVAYCLLFADINANVVFDVVAACFLSGSGQAVVLVVVRLMFQLLFFFFESLFCLLAMLAACVFEFSCFSI